MKNLSVLLLALVLFTAIAATAHADGRANDDGSPPGVEKQKIGASNEQGAPTPVPEPMTLALLGGGLVGIYGLKKKLDRD